MTMTPVPHMPAAPSGDSMGVFRALLTHDGQALERDGEPFYALNELAGARRTYEVMFGDGMWMIAEPGDVDAHS